MGGGAEAFERLTETFYAKVLKDDLIGPLFAHMDPGHPRYVAMWLGEVFGGPDRYTRERGAIRTCSPSTSARASPSRSGAAG
nr:hypothetical protein GCM10020093_059100 [Planobispora longispora]